MHFCLRAWVRGVLGWQRKGGINERPWAVKAPPGQT